MTTKKTTPAKAATGTKKSTAKTPAKKSVEAAPAVVAAPVVVARADFEEVVRAEAHALARGRGFRGGSPFGDWLCAEAAVLARFTAEGRAVPRRNAPSAAQT